MKYRQLFVLNLDDETPTYFGCRVKVISHRRPTRDRETTSPLVVWNRLQRARVDSRIPQCLSHRRFLLAIVLRFISECCTSPGGGQVGTGARCPPFQLSPRVYSVLHKSDENCERDRTVFPLLESSLRVLIATLQDVKKLVLGAGRQHCACFLRPRCRLGWGRGQLSPIPYLPCLRHLSPLYLCGLATPLR